MFATLLPDVAMCDPTPVSETREMASDYVEMLRCSILTDTQLVRDGWSKSALEKAIKAKRLKAVKQGTGFVVTQGALDEWIELEESGSVRKRESAPVTPEDGQPPRRTRQQALVRWQNAVDAEMACNGGDLTRARFDAAAKHPDRLREAQA